MRQALLTSERRFSVHSDPQLVEHKVADQKAVLVLVGGNSERRNYRGLFMHDAIEVESVQAWVCTMIS